MGAPHAFPESITIYMSPIHLIRGLSKLELGIISSRAINEFVKILLRPGEGTLAATILSRMIKWDEDCVKGSLGNLELSNMRKCLKLVGLGIFFVASIPVSSASQLSGDRQNDLYTIDMIYSDGSNGMDPSTIALAMETNFDSLTDQQKEILGTLYGEQSPDLLLEIASQEHLAAMADALGQDPQNSLELLLATEFAKKGIDPEKDPEAAAQIMADLGQSLANSEEGADLLSFLENSVEALEGIGMDRSPENLIRSFAEKHLERIAALEVPGKYYSKEGSAIPMSSAESLQAINRDADSKNQSSIASDSSFDNPFAELAQGSLTDLDSILENTNKNGNQPLLAWNNKLDLDQDFPSNSAGEVKYISEDILAGVDSQKAASNFSNSENTNTKLPREFKELESSNVNENSENTHTGDLPEVKTIESVQTTPEPSSDYAMQSRESISPSVNSEVNSEVESDVGSNTPVNNLAPEEKSTVPFTNTPSLSTSPKSLANPFKADVIADQKITDVPESFKSIYSTLSPKDDKTSVDKFVLEQWNSQLENVSAGDHTTSEIINNRSPSVVETVQAEAEATKPTSINFDSGTCRSKLIDEISYVLAQTDVYKSSAPTQNPASAQETLTGGVKRVGLSKELSELTTNTGSALAADEAFFGEFCTAHFSDGHHSRRRIFSLRSKIATKLAEISKTSIDQQEPSFSFANLGSPPDSATDNTSSSLGSGHAFTLGLRSPASTRQYNFAKSELQGIGSALKDVAQAHELVATEGLPEELTEELPEAAIAGKCSEQTIATILNQGNFDFPVADLNQAAAQAKQLRVAEKLLRSLNRRAKTESALCDEVSLLARNKIWSVSDLNEALENKIPGLGQAHYKTLAILHYESLRAFQNVLGYPSSCHSGAPEDERKISRTNDAVKEIFRQATFLRAEKATSYLGAWSRALTDDEDKGVDRLKCINGEKVFSSALRFGSEASSQEKLSFETAAQDLKGRFAKAWGEAVTPSVEKSQHAKLAPKN